MRYWQISTALIITAFACGSRGADTDASPSPDSPPKLADAAPDANTKFGLPQDLGTLPLGRKPCQIQIVGDKIYLLGRGQPGNDALARMGANGLSYSRMADPLTDVTRFKVAEGFMLWGEAAGKVRVLDKNALVITDPIEIETGLTRPGDVAVDASHLYVTLPNEGIVARRSRTQNANLQIAVPGGKPTRLIIDSNNLYYTNEDASAPYIGRFALSLGSSEKFSLTDRPEALSQDATHLYWSTKGSTGASIARIAKTGGTIETLLTGLGGVAELTVSAGFVYAADVDTGMIHRIDTQSHDAEVVASGFDRPCGITAEAGTLYISEQATGKIYAVALPK